MAVNVTPRRGEQFDCPDCKMAVKPHHMARSYQMPDSNKLVDLFLCSCKNCEINFVQVIEVGPR